MGLFVLGCQSEIETSHPNIIIILADDLGSGDLSSYNETSQIHTPNIDKLAREGMRFTQAHSPSSVCSPTRYGLLTGRYAWRTELKKHVLWPWDPPLLEHDRLTLPKMLNQKGYYTAAVGKWHLGWNWPTTGDHPPGEQEGQHVDFRSPIRGGPVEHGFDYYFGDDVPNFPPYTFIENDSVLTVPTVSKPDSLFGYDGFMAPGWELDKVMPEITHKSVEIIESVAQAEKPRPFFLYFSLTAPHTPIVPLDRFRGKSNAGRYGDYVYQIDWTVGQILKTLEQYKLEDNTLVIFTSDNGSPARDGSNMSGEIGSVTENFGHDPSNGYRGRKGDIWEGGHRVPFIARWPGYIPAGTVSREVISLVDVMATTAAIVDFPIQDHTAEDSYNLVPILFGEDYEKPLREATVTHSWTGDFAIRKNSWKLIATPGSGGFRSFSPDTLKSLPKYQLYNLEKDPRELNNLHNDKPEVVKDLKERLLEYINNGRSTPGESQKNEPVKAWPQYENLISG